MVNATYYLAGWIIGMLLSFAIGFLCAIKAVQLGLRWKLQTDEKLEPMMSNPISDVLKKKNKNEFEQYSQEQVKEWLYGE